MSNEEEFSNFLKGDIKKLYQQGYYADSSKKNYLKMLSNFPEYSKNIFLINDPQEIQKILDDIKSKKLIQNSASHRKIALELYKIFLKEKYTDILIEKDINSIKNLKISSTEKKRLINSRLGQGEYREDLISLWKGCSITHCNQIDILIASHIKPWRDANNTERIDKFNGFLLLPTLDKLFDKGYISFDKNGKILISDKIKKQIDILNINTNMNINIYDENKKYLEYHNKNIYKN
jgi:hypothetical protein